MTATLPDSPVRILLICYYFPPMGGGGVQRVLKFTKYLARDGARVTVVCADDPHYVHDETLAREIPDSARVVRVRHSTWVNRLLAWRRRRRGNAPAVTREAAVSGSGSSLRRMALKLLALRNNLLFPDDKRGWAAKARKAVAELYAQGERWDVVVSSAPPFSAHTVGAWAKKHYHLPWIADYRDLWSDNPENDNRGLRRLLERRYEHHLLAQADQVVTVGDYMAELFRTSFGLERTRVHVIPNGYDEDDFAGRIPAGRSDAVEFFYVGTLYGKRDPEPFLRGFAAIMEQRPDLALRVTFAGSVGERYRDLLDGYVARFPGRVRRLDYLPHGAAVQGMLDADVLLLLVGGDQTTLGDLTGKIFEYLRAARPILLVGQPDGDAARLLQHLNRGLAVGVNESKAVADAIAVLCESTQNFDLTIESVLQFSRESQARHLLSIVAKTSAKSMAQTS